MGIKERRQREKNLRRRQILTAMKKLHSEKDFKDITINDIAKEAEISPATIYLYFKNKEDLFASLCLSFMQFMSSKLEYITNDENQNPKQKLEALKIALYEIYETEPSVLIKTLHLYTNEAISNLSPNSLSDINRLFLKSFKSIVKIFDEGINDGDFFIKNSMALANIFWALFVGTVLWEDSKKIMGVKREHLRETLEIAFEIFGSRVSVCSEAA